MNQDEWYAGVQKWLLENCIPQGDPTGKPVGWTCKECKVDMQGKGRTVSLHLERSFGMPLAGFGETVEIIEPFCPKCKKRYSIPPFLEHGGRRDMF